MTSLKMQIVKILNTNILTNNYVHMNYWSIVHFAAGIIIALFITQNIALAIGILILYEIIELHLVGTLTRKETRLDIIWDIAWGILGFLAAQRWILNG